MKKRVNNGQYNPLERLAFLRSIFFPQVGETTGGQLRPVRSQAEGTGYPEFVENVMFRKHSVMFATVHVVGATIISSRGWAFRRRTAALRRGPIALPSSSAVRRLLWRGSTTFSPPPPARGRCSC